MIWNLFGGRKKKENNNGGELIDSGNIRAVVLTDIGNIRTNNEDRGLFFRHADEDGRPRKGCLLLVADGMGGHLAGEVASNLAAEVISHEYFRHPENEKPDKALSKAFEAANKKIFTMASQKKAYHGMGTTATALVIIDEQIYYAHAGDSRAYILSDHHLIRITEDHTYVQDLVNKGQIPAHEADAHPNRNILTNAMGTRAQIRIDHGLFKQSFGVNDRLLLCSDGLYDYLSDKELEDILKTESIHDAGIHMIREAKSRGGHDNITLVLAERNDVAAEEASKETRDIIIPGTKEHDVI